MDQDLSANATFSKAVLLVEDNEDDILVTQRAFNKADKFQGRLFVAVDGEEALDFIHNKNTYKNKQDYPRPDIILLDINLPKLNGLEFLEIIKSDPKYNDIPVVILSSSENELDINQSYASGAASYLAKPVSFKKFMDIVNTFNDYWLLNRFPKR
ncbi:response regulator [Thermoproteota archaeon]